jgi:hypothetical protein
MAQNEPRWVPPPHITERRPVDPADHPERVERAVLSHLPAELGLELPPIDSAVLDDFDGQTVATFKDPEDPTRVVTALWRDVRVSIDGGETWWSLGHRA